MSEIPVYIKGSGKVLQANPAPGNQHTNADTTPAPTLPKGDVKATAKSAKITLVLDPSSITRVDSEGKKQTKLIVTVGAMKFEVMINSKSYRKALALIDEYGMDGCHPIIQGTMTAFGKIEGAGLAVQQKAIKPAPEEQAHSS